MRGSKETRTWEGACSAIKTAVHAYARDPSEANAKEVRAALLRKRVLDDRQAQRVFGQLSKTWRQVPTTRR